VKYKEDDGKEDDGKENEGENHLLKPGKGDRSYLTL